MDGNTRIFERVKASLTQNNKNLSPEDLEVLKCIFAAMITGLAAGPGSGGFSSAGQIIKIGREMGFIKGFDQRD